MRSAGHPQADLPLGVTVTAPGRELRRALDEVRSGTDLRFIQLSAQQPGLRARDLDQSARRDLAATLRRRELELSGLDLWIPASHLREPEHVSRAIETIMATIGMAADLGRCPVSLILSGDDIPGEVVEAIDHHAARHGVPLADFGLGAAATPPHCGIGIDPAALLGRSEDPAAAVAVAGDSLVAARLSDLLTSGMRGPPGARDGQLDVLEYKVALAVAGYKRPVLIDTRQWPDPMNGVRQAVEHWRSLP